MIATELRQTTAEQIATVYAAQRSTTGWVSLETIRTELAYIAPAEIDRALLDMAIVSRTALVDPVANLKSLTPGQRAAAITIGGEDCHAIKVKGVMAYEPRHAR